MSTEPGYTAEIALGSKVLSGVKVLVVEDNEDINFLMCQFLRLADATVDSAIDGASAFEFLKNSTYQMVLMDIRLPDVSGIDIVRKIRSEGNLTPVIAVSAHGKAVFGDSLLQAEFNGYLSKPVSSQQLVENITNLLKVSKDAGSRN